MKLGIVVSQRNNGGGFGSKEIMSLLDVKQKIKAKSKSKSEKTLILKKKLIILYVI